MADEIDRSLAGALQLGEMVVLATVVTGLGTGRRMVVWSAGQTLGSLGDPRLNQRASLHAELLFSRRRGGRKSFELGDHHVSVKFDLHGSA